MNIAIVGAGYVGLVSGACFAELGHTVICVDNDGSKINALKKLKIPIYEPGLEELVKRSYKAGRISFTTDIKAAVKKSLAIFIAVGTPPKENGEADLTGIEKVAQSVAKAMDGYRLVIEKSTVPVDTGRWVKHTLEINKKKGVNFDVASNPEFLREGNAISDFMHPDRIVVGVESKKAENILRELYTGIKAPFLVTDIKSAELIKHASNSFLALKISYINAVSRVCELSGADIELVAEGMGLDKRVGRSFLDAGIGFGGFCLPKDVDAFVTISQKLGYGFELLKEVKRINDFQKEDFVRKIECHLWNIKDKTIGILGLAFKPETDDMRFAPSIDIIRLLQRYGAKIRAYDPKAEYKARAIFKDVKFCKDAYDTAKGSDCLVLITEWEEFRNLDFNKIKKLLKQPLLLDGRNVYDPKKMKALGFKYVCIGR
ncbi:MAG TPA: UDP-glucose/GDP-mannose dehydrogenase family protein [Candidatus Omnitrophota bacterium]|nr:UDP-glucose/GDP-mannose dehydrogenase family protein [Candidatus Omnitrophota bacterium]